MFSRVKPFLIYSNIQYVFRCCQNQSTNLINFLKSIKESPPSPCYSRLFFDCEVQNLLKKVSNIDFEKVFKTKPRGKKLRSPVYQLLTKEELEEAMAKAESKANYLLQIPPLISPAEDKAEILDNDNSLDGHDEHHSKYVFIDISPDGNNEERVVVVREANGILRTALKNEKVRTNQVYYPIPGRELDVPKMFETENLMNIIMRKDYEFILDRACAQFEPDEPLYHEIITLTYEAINFQEDFEMLLSTRHFGSLVFYLVTHNKIDNLILYNLKNDRLDDVLSIVKLYYIIHPPSNSDTLSKNNDDQAMLKNYMSLSPKKNTLQKSFKAYLKREMEKKNLKVEIKEAHGF